MYIDVSLCIGNNFFVGGTNDQSIYRVFWSVLHGGRENNLTFGDY